MTLLNLLIINLVVVLIIDLSDFIPTLKRFISKRLTNNKITTDEFSLKPFDCSFCMTFWILLSYLLIIGQFTFVNLLWLILLTYLTDVTKQFMILLKDLLNKLINLVYDKLSL